MANDNCACCLALAKNCTGEEATATLLAIMGAQAVSYETVHSDLCGPHRRMVDSTIEAVKSHIAGGG